VWSAYRLVQGVRRRRAAAVPGDPV